MTTTAVGGNSASFTTPNLTTQTSYWVRVSNAFGPSVDSAAAVISIGAAAAITTQPQSQTIASGATPISASAPPAPVSRISGIKAPHPIRRLWSAVTAPTSPHRPDHADQLLGARQQCIRAQRQLDDGHHFDRRGRSHRHIAPEPDHCDKHDGDPQRRSHRDRPAYLSVVLSRHVAGRDQFGGSNSASFITPALTTATSYWVRVSNRVRYRGLGHRDHLHRCSARASITPAQSQTIASGTTADSASTPQAPISRISGIKGTSGSDDDARREQQSQLHHAGSDHDHELLGPRSTTHLAR